jgi:hypothetical protein
MDGYFSLKPSMVALGVMFHDFGKFAGMTGCRWLGDVRRFRSSTGAIKYCFKPEHGNQKHMLFAGRLIHFSESMHFSGLWRKLLPLSPTIFRNSCGQRGEFTISWTRAGKRAIRLTPSWIPTDKILFFVHYTSFISYLKPL